MNRFQRVRKNKKFTEHTLAKRQSSLAQCQAVETGLNEILKFYNIPWEFSFQDPIVEENLKYFYYDAARPGKIGETEPTRASRVTRELQKQQQQQQQLEKAELAKKVARKARRAKKSAHLKKRAARKAFYDSKMSFG